jgi:hypothetical protein
MATVPTKPYRPTRSQNIALQRLVATREEVVLLSHLFQAAWEVERDSPVRRAITAHWDLVRNVMVILVVLLSIALGLLAPQISQALVVH